MIVQVSLSGKIADIHLDGDPDSLLVADLCVACLHRFPDVQVHHQKLLHRGKRLHHDHSLVACGVHDGSKVMLLASMARTQVISVQQRLPSYVCRPSLASSWPCF
jgi:hypothetical protein